MALKMTRAHIAHEKRVSENAHALKICGARLVLAEEEARILRQQFETLATRKMQLFQDGLKLNA